MSFEKKKSANPEKVESSGNFWQFYKNFIKP